MKHQYNLFEVTDKRTKQNIDWLTQRYTERLDIDEIQLHELFEKLHSTGFFKDVMEISDFIDKSIRRIDQSKIFLDTLEKEDAVRFVQRSLLLWKLNSSEFPLYTNPEVLNIIDVIIGYLNENRVSIIKYGGAERKFPLEFAYSDSIEFLYPTKLFCQSGETYFDKSILEINDLFFEEMEKFYRGEESLIDMQLINGEWKYDSNKLSRWIEADPEKITYENSPYTRGLSETDAEILDKNREKLLDLKINVLKDIYQKVKFRDYASLLDDSTQIIAQALESDWEELQYYFKIDNIYPGYDILAQKYNKSKTIYTSGGITFLFIFILFVHEQLNLKIYSNLYNDLEKLLHRIKGTRPSLNFDSYITMGDSKKFFCDAADSYWNNIGEITILRSDYIANLSSLLRSKFEKTISFKVSKEIAKEISEFLKPIFDHAVSMQMQAGKMPEVSYDSKMTVARNEGQNIPIRKLVENELSKLFKISNLTIAKIEKLSQDGEKFIYEGFDYVFFYLIHLLRNENKFSKLKLVAIWISENIYFQYKDSVSKKKASSLQANFSQRGKFLKVPDEYKNWEEKFYSNKSKTNNNTL